MEVEDAETLYVNISWKNSLLWICFHSQCHGVIVIPTSTPKPQALDAAVVGECVGSTWGWGVILKTPNRSNRCWNKLYVYGEDLTRVWRGCWGASIITYTKLQGETERISYDCHCDCETPHSGWGCILMTSGHSSRCWKPLYRYEVDLLWKWIELGGLIITYSMMQARNQVNHLLPLLYLF